MIYLTLKRFSCFTLFGKKHTETQGKQQKKINGGSKSFFNDNKKIAIPTFALAFFASSLANSQMVISDLETGSQTAQDLVNQLVGGDGVTISNVSTTGNPRCFGSFSGGANSVGFDGGVIISSGSALDAAGPNFSDETTSEFFEPGDTFLSSLIFGEPTYDACVLEFDFQCNSADSISVEYVMGSEEYNEFVEAGSNDVFGFALNGINIATLPNSGGLPVSIENVNCGNPYDPNSTEPYCDLFINNDLQDGGGSIDIEADGLTTVLTAEQNVGVGTVNTMKFAVGDVLDEAFDTWVFLRNGSFQCGDGGGSGPQEDIFSTNLSSTCTVWNDTDVYYNEDIISFNEDTQTIQILFDGSDVGLAYANVDAFTQLPSGEFILSLSQNFEVPGVGYVRDEDLIKFTPSTLGDNTSGVFEMYFDGSAHGMGNCGGDIDALDVVEGVVTGTDADSDGIANELDSCPLDPLNDIDGDGVCGNVKIYFSLTSSVEINGNWYKDEDVIEFDEATGEFSKYFDGSDVGMSHTDVDAFKIKDDGNLLLSLKCSTTINGVGSVLDQDILEFTPTSLGVTTAGSFEIKLRGNDTGLVGNYFDFDGVDRVLQ